jgi:transcription antitermination factor NusG
VTLATVNPQIEEHQQVMRAFVEQSWYAIYTFPNHEKRVAAEIAVRGFEHFLPLFSSIRRWKDRRVSLELPLFPGYVFVRLALRDRLRVLQIPSVLRFVGFGGQPTPLADDEMESLKSVLSRRLRAEPYRFLTVGRRVRVLEGAFEGLEGILVRHRGKLRVVIAIKLIQRSMSVELDTEMIEALTK